MENSSPQQIERSGIDPRCGEDHCGKGHLSWQEDLLSGVSRTFALTIPQLPSGLRTAVTNAYLLCRIADTIEDDPLLLPDTKDRFHNSFLRAVTSGRGAEEFAAELAPLLAPSTPAAEVELIEASPRVLRVTEEMDSRQRVAIQRCLDNMSRGITIGKISDNPLFTSGTQVKVSRPRVAAIIAGSSALIRSDDGLTKLFDTAGRALPPAPDNPAPTLIRKESTTP